MSNTRDTFTRLRSGAQAIAFSSPLYALTLAGRTPDRLAATPPDAWPGDATTGMTLLSGNYAFAGQSFSGESAPWLPEKASVSWVEAMHSFDWLRDLKALGGDNARRHARTLVGDWIEQHGSNWHSLTWAPHVLGTRIANWIGMHDFFWASADDAFRARMFDSLGRQLRHLSRVLPGDAASVQLLAAIKGLIYGSLGLAGNEKALLQARKLLERELPRQILADGGHVERCPSTQLRVLRLLIDMRTALRAGRAEVPDALQHAIDRMTPTLRFFRHGDGGLALFNNSQEENPAIIDMALTQSDARGKPLKSAPHIGFERLLAGRTLILMDTGPVPAEGLDTTAHAGTLSFEMSVGRERIIVNCGAHPSDAGPWRLALAATAAHSALVVADTNSSEVLEDGGLGRRPEQISCERAEADGAILVEASHDGYMPLFGLTHRRRLYLADGGEDLRGEDTLEGPSGQSFAVRFHLHPSVQVSLIQNGSAALLRLPSGNGWRLRASGADIRIEESVYLGDGDVRRTSQLVLNGTTEPERTVIKWAFRREKKTA